MFKGTLTFITVFLVLNQLHLSTTRNIETPKTKQEEKKREVEESNLEPEVHSRQKRLVSLGTAFRAASSAAVLGSVGVTIYTEITKCKNFDPSDCKTPSCHYYDCPSVCKGPDKNDDYIQREKDDINDVLDDMDDKQLDVYNLALTAGSVSLSTEAMFNAIDDINNEVDRVMYSMAQMDRNISIQFANRSNDIKALLQDERFSLDEVVGSGDVQGIFDEWTWEGTGLFVLGLALPIGIKGAAYLRKRYAINKIYKEMRTDFLTKLDQTKFSGSTKGQAYQKDAWIKSFDRPKIQNAYKETAKQIYKAQQAKATPSKLATGLGYFMEGAIAALSIYSTWRAIDACQELANDMHDNALKIAEQRDGIEEIRQTELDPLLEEVNNELWPSVKGLLTNETTIEWLEEIRNLTLGAENANTTTAETIRNFVDSIDQASPDAIVKLQNELITALKSVEFEYSCLGDKIHAINTVLGDCEDGDDTLENLYNEVAVVKNELNRDDCVNDDMVPYTSFSVFKNITETFAEREGWYSNCLLNSGSFLYEVCSEYLKGYTEPNQIIEERNYTRVTTDMVENFLTRCPEPEITPKSEDDTCQLYCLYIQVSEIAKSVILKESQVESIIPRCGICEFSEKEKTEICHQYYCEGINITVTMDDVELPLSTVQYVINNNCSSKCIITDEDVKSDICQKSKCNGLASDVIAEDVEYSVEAVNDVIVDCDTIVPQCEAIDQETIDKVLLYHCTFNVPAQFIAGNIVELSLAKVEEIIAANGCP